VVPREDDDCLCFMRWALPRMGLRPRGFRRPRRQVCRRIRRRAAELGLDGLAAYRERLLADPGEWAVLDALCVVTITRFFRDRGVFELLGVEVLPEVRRAALDAGRPAVEAWSAGCAAGEEAYSLVLLPGGEPPLRVLGTDTSEDLLGRARRGCYGESSVKEVPAGLRAAAFEERDGLICVSDLLRRGVRFLRGDVREPPPGGSFDLVLCRNLVFTYYEGERLLFAARVLRDAVRPGGALVVGAHEALPPDALAGLEGWFPERGVYRRAPGSEKTWGSSR
jgi:chemotaxis protein methyltransferase CheR